MHASEWRNNSIQAPVIVPQIPELGKENHALKQWRVDGFIRYGRASSSA